MAEFINDEISEFNAHSHAMMKENLSKQLMTVSVLTHPYSYEEKRMNTMMISNIYSSLEKLFISSEKKQKLSTDNATFVRSKNISTSCYA